MNLIEMFKIGMKRDIPYLIPAGEVIVNLGCGKNKIAGALNLDYPEWNAETADLPPVMHSVDTIYAFHFFEHLTAKSVMRILKECERVLKVGGTLNIVVPHRLSQMAYHDLDHKTFFCEETWRNLFNTEYYVKNKEVPWKFDINTNIIIGLNERNLALLTQLVRK